MATILVVDDEEISRMMLEQFLTKQGHTVLVATDGLAALSILQTLAVDLVLTDAWMPNLTGLSLLARIRQNPAFARLPVILFSGSSRDDLVLVGDQRTSVLQKPFRFATLEAAIRQILGG